MARPHGQPARVSCRPVAGQPTGGRPRSGSEASGRGAPSILPALANLERLLAAVIPGRGDERTGEPSAARPDRAALCTNSTDSDSSDRVPVQAVRQVGQRLARAQGPYPGDSRRCAQRRHPGTRWVETPGLPPPGQRPSPGPPGLGGLLERPAGIVGLRPTPGNRPSARSGSPDRDYAPSSSRSASAYR